MAKSLKKRQSEPPISINKIYETIKGRNFTQDLWLDLISDIKEKPTYKRMKEMVNSVINGSLSDFDTEPVDNAERLRRRAVLTEISIMAYTVDRVISEVLYRRLQNEFKKIIGNMLEDLQTEKPEKKVTSSYQISSMFENIESIFTNQTVKEEKIEKGSKSNAEVPVRKRGRPKKQQPEIKPKVAPAPVLKRGRPPQNSNRRNTSEFEPKKKKQSLATTSRQNMQKADVKTGLNLSNQKESDTESDGDVSIETISSVHTTDLSSFEDTISICSDDGKNGRKKKKVSLKTANDLILHGKLSQIYQFGKKSEEYKNLVASDPARKVLPQRVRKPNSKYNSETMYCQVKDYSSPRTDSVSTLSSAEEADTTRLQPIQKRENKCFKTSSNENEQLPPTSPVARRSVCNLSPTKTNASPKLTPPISSSTPVKGSTQRYDSSDLYKPRSNFGSTCNSRGATAFTVFST